MLVYALGMPTNPYCISYTPGGNIAVHRKIAEQICGRRIKRYELVHHLGWNKANNAPSNLVVLTRPQHRGIHAAGIRYF